MRLSQEQIKEFLLHPESRIRNRVLDYFALSDTPDVSIMPLVIKAIEKYGKADAFEHPGKARRLGQTEQTVDWLIGELNDEETGLFSRDSLDRTEGYSYNLSLFIKNIDMNLLRPRQADILASRYLEADARVNFSERLQMQSWDAIQCWQKLEEFCEDLKNIRDKEQINCDYPDAIVDALARLGPGCEGKVLEYLAVKLDNYVGSSISWLQLFAARLAGLAHLESAIPFLIAKFQEHADSNDEYWHDQDWDVEDLDDENDELEEPDFSVGSAIEGECLEALSRIGSPAVVRAIAEAFPTASFDARIDATLVLENIHSDLSEELCLRLFQEHDDADIRLVLVDGLLKQFSRDSIGIARQFILDDEDDWFASDLRVKLLETCRLMGERFPEYDQWQEELLEEQSRLEEIMANPEELLRGIGLELNDLATPLPDTTVDYPPPPRSHPYVNEKQKVGRNDPCPCGSGKKYKRCCLKKPNIF